MNNDVLWVVQEYSRGQNNHNQVPITEQVFKLSFKVFLNESFGDSTNQSVYLQTTHVQPPDENVQRVVQELNMRQNNQNQIPITEQVFKLFKIYIKESLVDSTTMLFSFRLTNHNDLMKMCNLL